MSQARIRLYDTLSGELRDLVPREPGVVRMYTCGPTVYSYTHIGHLRPVLIGDVLVRHLQARGYRVIWLSNFTDVDDRIIERARQEGVEPTVFAQRYIDDYLENLRRLGVRGVERFARVTEHIPQIVDMVQTLVTKGYAYPVDGDVYFAVQSRADYGKLSGRTLEEMRAGARVEVDERKRHPMDFALWKAAKPGEPSWPSPWGPGRPGWHIECSAMSLGYLGNGFDIHGGGSDLIFPHHENEIAQSEAFTGSEPFVRIWLHNAMVMVDREKISKSLGNFTPLRELVRQRPVGALRLFVLSTHYRKPLHYSAGALDEALKAWRRLMDAVGTWPGLPPAAAAPRDEGALASAARAAAAAFAQALDNDLNTPEAIGHLFELVRAGNAALAEGREPAGLSVARSVLQTCGEQLGIWEGSDAPAQDGGDRAGALVDLLIELRAEARGWRDWSLADRIRDGLGRAGVILEDRPDGTRWKWSAEPPPDREMAR